MTLTTVDASTRPGRRPRPPGSTATTPSPRSPRADAPDVPCPVCGRSAGFILDIDGIGYRVLEDAQDTGLLEDQDADRVLSCARCATPITVVAALALPTRPAARHGDRHPEHHRTRHRRPRRGHPHPAGTARQRKAADGRPLPACPQCPREHGFLADIDGVAYHVLEDDADTDLLPETTDLLCPTCGAVFTLPGTA